MTVDQSHVLIGITAMFLTLCLIAVGGRLIARRLQTMRLEADDWSCVVAFVGVKEDQDQPDIRLIQRL